MTTLDRLVVSIAIVGLMAMIAVTPFYTRDLVLRGLPERRCHCPPRTLWEGYTNLTTTNLYLPRIATGLPIIHYPMLTNPVVIGWDATNGPRFFDLNAQLIGTNAADTKRLNLGMTNPIPASVAVVGSITNTSGANGDMWIPVPGLRTNLTLSNRVVRAVIKMDGNKMITVELEP